MKDIEVVDGVELLDFIDITGKNKPDIFFLLGYLKSEPYFNGEETVDHMAAYCTNVKKVSQLIYLIEYQTNKLKLILKEKGDIYLNQKMIDDIS